MKKIKSLALLALLMLSIGVQAGAIQEANQQLRSIFSGLHSPDPTVRILYDMAAHRIDSSFYSIMCMDTTNTDKWYFLYEEVYNAAYDTTTFPTENDIVLASLDRYSDTLQIGIIDLRYLYFMPKALTTGDFFKFELEDNVLLDAKENRIGEDEAYGLGEVFMAAPLLWSSQTLNPTYEITPSAIFLDNVTRMEDFEHLRFRIDFGDGQGWHYTSLHTQSFIDAYYHAKGVYYITSELIDNHDQVIKHSVSSVYIDGTDDFSYVDYTFRKDVPAGMRVFEIKPRCRYTDDDKYIFILAGYNPLSFFHHGVRKFDELYKKYVYGGNHEALLNYGYTIVIVDWKDHNDYIQDNAMRFVQLLEQYKCEQKGDEEFVVIGQSMGCLIGRYALTWMESEKYVPRTDCKREKRHNTRLFISNDGPHQGVNIPLSLQSMYGEVFSDTHFVSAISDILTIVSLGQLNFSTTLLQGKSVRQMLYYHYATEQNGYYYPDQLHNDYLDDLKNIGGFPKYCKLVALSNGSIEGFRQQQLFSSDPSKASRFRQYNDLLLETSLYSGFRILGMKFGVGFSARLNTNPLGYGELYRFSIESHHPTIRLFWFGIAITDAVDVISLHKDAKNTIPYCIVPGGNKYLTWVNNEKYSSFYFPFVGGELSKSDGCINATGYAGIPWLCDVEGSFKFCTDGLGFSFVPVVSAFDYQTTSYGDLYTDFVHGNKQSIFTRTPFDVLIGQYANDTKWHYNIDHERIINKPVRPNLSQTREIYSSLVTNSYLDTVRVVNRIIGDEDLWLNNIIKPWEAQYSAERNIFINIPEDFLFHETGISEVDEKVGAYSRDGLFIPLASGPNIFVASDNIKVCNYDKDWKEQYGSKLECNEDYKPIKKIHDKQTDINIQVSSDGNVINISSSEDLDSYRLYTIEGWLLSHNEDIEQSVRSIEIEHPSTSGPIVAVIYTKSGYVHSKIIIR